MTTAPNLLRKIAFVVAVITLADAGIVADTAASVTEHAIFDAVWSAMTHKPGDGAGVAALTPGERLALDAEAKNPGYSTLNDDPVALAADALFTDISAGQVIGDAIQKARRAARPDPGMVVQADTRQHPIGPGFWEIENLIRVEAEIAFEDASFDLAYNAVDSLVAGEAAARAAFDRAVILQSPGNAFDRIDLKKRTAPSKCEGCNVQYANLKGLDLEGAVDTTPDSTMQILSTPGQTYANLKGLDLEGAVDTTPDSTMQILSTPGQTNVPDKRNPAGQTQYAQNPETKKSVDALKKVKKSIDALRAIFLRLIKNPADLEVNVSYAKLAEKRGHIGRALATYERLALLDPKNKRWKDNIERLRDLARPPETTIAAVFGGRFDVNGPVNADGVGNRAEYNASMVLTLDHKRSVEGLKYQATGLLFADGNFKFESSDLILVALQVGPLFKISKSWQLRPAILAERSTTDRTARGNLAFRSSLSWSAGTLFNFANLDEGPIRTVDTSLYFVGFDNETNGRDAIVFTSSSGLGFQGFRKSDQWGLTPDFTFNGARGGRGTDGFRDLYYVVGFNLDYEIQVLENFRFGPTFSYHYKDYLSYEPRGSSKRDDHNFVTGLQASASEIIPKIELLGTYSYERNISRTTTETYRNHSMGLSFLVPL